MSSRGATVRALRGKHITVIGEVVRQDCVHLIFVWWDLE